MANWKMRSVVLASLFMFLSPDCIPQALPPEVEQALHQVNVLEIDSRDALSIIWDLRDNPDLADIIVLDNIYGSYLATPQVEILKNWVMEGHSLWLRFFQDEYLMSLFGLIGHTKSGGKYFPSKCLGEPASVHPVLTDVELVRLGCFWMGCHLMYFTAGYDAVLLSCAEKPTAVLKRYGRGWILACPEIDTERYDGMRFCVNLQEFLAGYPVPGSVMTGMLYPPEPLERYDMVMFKNGDVRSGRVLTEHFTIEAPYGTFTLNVDYIAKVELADGTDHVFLWMGDRISGILKTPELVFELAVEGEMVTLDMDDLKEIIFARR